MQDAYDKGWTLVEIDREGKALRAFKRNDERGLEDEIDAWINDVKSEDNGNR